MSGKINLSNQRNPLQLVGIVLCVVGLMIILGGHLYQEGKFIGSLLIKDLWANVGAEILSIALTVLIIDRLNNRRLTTMEKSRLLLQMASPDSSVSQEAIRLLRAYGWLQDGSLREINLAWANLERGYLWNADLQGAKFLKANLKNVYLTYANLKGALDLSVDQLRQARNMKMAIMPDGSLYDGRFNLDGDIFRAQENMVDINSPNAMAKFYGVSLESYKQGQNWAQNNPPQKESEVPNTIELRKLKGDEEQVPED